MGIGVGGIISGLDTNTIISQMMEIERTPIVQLQQDEAFYQSKISAVGVLKGALSALQTSLTDLKDADDFISSNTTSSNTAVLTVSSSGTENVGSYQLEVTNLAKAQQVRSSSFTGSDQVVGTGTLTIQVGTGDAVDITIDSDNNTLAEIATAINAADTDVNASVIDDGDGNFYLALSSKETGLNNTISLSIDDDDTFDNDAGGLSSLYTTPATSSLTQTQPGENAELILNGLAVERAGNSIDDLIGGLTLNLEKEDPGVPLTIKVAEDLSTGTEKVQEFVTSYNALVDSLTTLQNYDAETGASGSLQGDSTTRMIHTRIQNLLHTQVSGIADEVNGLDKLGIEIDKDGKMKLDTSALQTALMNNRSDVIGFFSQEETNNNGFAVQLDDVLESYLSTSGILGAKEDGLKSSVEDISDTIDRINTRLVKKEETLQMQFQVLEKLLAEFETTSGVLTNQLASLDNLNSQIYKN